MSKIYIGQIEGKELLIELLNDYKKYSITNSWENADILFKATFKGAEHFANKVLNVFPCHEAITNKKNLLTTLREVFPEEKIIPRSFICTKDSVDLLVEKLHKTRLYIIKPTYLFGGNKINVMYPAAIRDYVNSNANIKLWIVQEYIANPLLIENTLLSTKDKKVMSKFDIRVNIIMKHDGTFLIYNRILLRVSDKEYTLQKLSQEIHVTNTDIRKHVSTNALRFLDNEAVLLQHKNGLYDFLETKILPILSIVKMPAKNETNYYFQRFGVDIMITEDGEFKLLEINTNPGHIDGDKELIRLDLHCASRGAIPHDYWNCKVIPNNTIFYSIAGDILPDINVLKELLQKEDWKLISSEYFLRFNVFIDLNINVHYRDGRAREKYANTIKNYVSTIFLPKKEPVGNKMMLYKNVKEDYPKEYSLYFDNSPLGSVSLYEVSSVENKNNDIYIVRPAKRFLGEGIDILIVTNNKELADAKKILSQKGYKTVLISKYIRNPLLLGKKKMHLRMYWCCIGNKQNGIIYSKVFPFGKIITAKKNYVYEDFHNRDIHDTHMLSTDENYYFPDNHNELGITLEKANEYYKKIKTIVGILKDILYNHVETYPESHLAMEVFGMDFMIDRDTDNPILLEVNVDAVGYAAIEKPTDADTRFAQSFYREYIAAVKFALGAISGAITVGKNNQ